MVAYYVTKLVNTTAWRIGQELGKADIDDAIERNVTVTIVPKNRNK